ncbi:pectinesterase family protein [Roseateles sp. DXS20W]|uniref:Pectinesterase n=1 Tax=Pelomonas lactea TaxID=3299030 RepID=A0ABW7GM27_9BURK
MTAHHSFASNRRALHGKAAVALAIAAGMAMPAWAATSTATRPQLSSSEQGSYTLASFLGSWAPGTVGTKSTGDYVVSPSGPYKTVQAAVNAAIAAGGTTRKYIQIKAGTYTGLVVIPSGVPLTLYGDSQTGVVLQLGAHYAMTGSAFKSAAGPSADYGSGAPSRVSAYYNDCGGRSTLGTNCTATVVSYASQLQIKNLTIQNTYGENNAAANGQHQAVAYLNNGGDQVQLDTVRLLGNQDTLWLAGAGKRTHVRNSFIQGDVDFIFGDMTAVFDGCEIRYTNARTSTGVIAAPSHVIGNKGFLFTGGSFTTTGGSNSVSFARQWPQNGGTTGQMIVREVVLGGHIKKTAPWADWNSSNPVNYGSAGNRRLAEYANTGSGAAP